MRSYATKSICIKKGRFSRRYKVWSFSVKDSRNKGVTKTLMLIYVSLLLTEILYILDTHDCEERILLEETGERRNKKQSWDSRGLAWSHKLWLHKIYFFFKKGNSNWQNEPGRQKKDKTYGHIAKSQTFSPLEGLKCLHNVKMKYLCWATSTLEILIASDCSIVLTLYV